MRKSAFCPLPANTDEHIWSDWMGRQLPPNRYRFRRLLEDGTLKQFEGPKIALKTRVVCDKCNNGWMSSIESDLKHSIFHNVIFKGTPATLSRQDIELISAFAFKTSVIANHMKLHGKPFFTKEELRRFAVARRLSESLHGWLARRQSIYAQTGIFKSAYGSHNHAKFSLIARSSG